jgi:plasmid stability protein
MKALNIRNIPDETYAALQEMARENHRSLQEQIRWLLEREVRMTSRHRAGLIEAREWRRKLRDRPAQQDVVDMVREDRER